MPGTQQMFNKSYFISHRVSSGPKRVLNEETGFISRKCYTILRLYYLHCCAYHSALYLAHVDFEQRFRWDGCQKQTLGQPQLLICCGLEIQMTESF